MVARVKYAEVVLAGIDGVDEVAEGAPDPVRLIAEARAGGHLSRVRAHSRWLVCILGIARVESERLLALTAEDEDLRIVQLDATDGLSTREIRVVHLDRAPSLARNHLTVLT